MRRLLLCLTLVMAGGCNRTPEQGPSMINESAAQNAVDRSNEIEAYCNDCPPENWSGPPLG